MGSRYITQGAQPGTLMITWMRVMGGVRGGEGGSGRRAYICIIVTD